MPQCEEPAKARGRCDNHYKKLMRGCRYDGHGPVPMEPSGEEGVLDALRMIEAESMRISLEMEKLARWASYTATRLSEYAH